MALKAFEGPGELPHNESIPILILPSQRLPTLSIFQFQLPSWMLNFTNLLSCSAVLPPEPLV